jgi:hypothetical protein
MQSFNLNILRLPIKLICSLNKGMIYFLFVVLLIGQKQNIGYIFSNSLIISFKMLINTTNFNQGCKVDLN